MYACVFTRVSACMRGCYVSLIQSSSDLFNATFTRIFIGAALAEMSKCVRACMCACVRVCTRACMVDRTHVLVYV